jgi:hypothetical protein
MVDSYTVLEMPFSLPLFLPFIEASIGPILVRTELEPRGQIQGGQDLLHMADGDPTRETG